MRKKLQIQKKNSGFSLVELIIAIAILSIVTAAVCGFIIVTSRNYANGNDDISVQQEAQLALNQMSDVIIDATRSINYVGYENSNPVKALKDSEFTFTPEQKSLIVYNTEAASEASSVQTAALTEASGTEGITGNAELKNYMFFWQKSDESLYFSIADASGSFPMPGEEECQLLAEHVTDFQVDLSQIEERRVVKLKLSFQSGSRKFEMANNITVRNKIVINDADIKKLDKKVHVNINVKKTEVILEPGETYTFSTPTVTGMNLIDKSVTWEILDADKVNAGTSFKDTTNGIVKIDGNEVCESFRVKVKTTAADEVSGKQAEATITVYVKRVTKVSLCKNSEELPDSDGTTPGELEVMQGSTVTLGGTVDGVKLEYPCDSCGDDTTEDKYLTGWTVVSGSGLLQNGIQDSDHETATIQIKTDATVGATITIRATSALSQKRSYGPVQGEITLTVVEKKNSVNPFDGVIKHGDQTRVDNIVFNGFDTRVNAHALVVHIVDNSTGEVAAYRVCMTQGWNIWLSPDYFDLDLRKSYTFYLQGLESVSKQEHERYDKEHGTMQKSSIETIGKEYDAHHSATAPFGYTGDMFKSSQVFSTILEPVQLTYAYDSKKYCAQQITFKTVNVLSISDSSYPSDGLNILDKLKFYKAEASNIDSNAFTVDDVKYSIYKGNGNDSANWSALYVYKQGSYQGSTSQYNGNVQFGIASSLPTIKVKRGRLSEVVGSYHVVPGIWYDPKAKIGNMPNEVYPTAFPVNSATKKYVEFPENTFHVTVTSEGTMNISTDRFNGSVCFPLPAEMKSNAIFTNLENTEWQDANIQDKDKGVVYNAIDSNKNITTIQFNRIRYRYDADTKYYYVEPISDNAKDGLTISYSYGIYRCSLNGSMWEKTRDAQETNNITLEFEKDGTTWLAHVPLPTDDDFMFTKESTEQQSKTNYTIKGYKRDSYNESKDLNSKVLYCDYDAAKEQYKLTLVTDEQTQGVVKTLKVAGIYTWKPGNTMWDKKQGEGTLTESLANIELTLDNKVYVAHIDPPSNQVSEDTSSFILYEKDNLNSSRDINCKRVYTYDAASKCTMTLVYKEETNGIYKTTETLGVYEWDKSKERWILKQEGKIDKVDISTISMTINGKSYRAYFPLPSDGQFWFSWGNEVTWKNLTLYSVDTNSKEDKQFEKTTCKHDTTNDCYTVTFMEIIHDWSAGTQQEVIIGKYTCSSTGTAWTQVN